MNIDEYMDNAEEAFDYTQNSFAGEESPKSAYALESIAASLIVANELEYMKVTMMQKEYEVQSAPAATIKTVDGKEIKL